MPLARTHSVALVGVTGHVVEIEADIANGLVYEGTGGFTIEHVRGVG